MFIDRSTPSQERPPRLVSALAIALALLSGAHRTAAEPEPANRQTIARALIEQFTDQHGPVGPSWDLLIATPPDPIDTPLSREFDLFVGALRRGLEDLGFVLDRHRFPWRLEERPQADSGHPREPGLLLFRRSGDSGTEVMAVLLVGETATRGIHDGALAAALDLAEEVIVARGDPATVANRRIKLLAPFFSGSRHALLASLEGWVGRAAKRAGTRFELISGTATNPDNPSTLEGHPGLELEYRSAATDDWTVYNGLLTFLADRLGIEEDSDPEEHQIALLVESSTYGGYFARFDRSRPLILPFPMHISQLRSELDKEREKRREQEAAAERDGAALLLGDPRRSPASLPVFAPVQTSRTQELALAAIVRTLTRNKVQAVGIIASDTRDKLFLADAVRRHARDVRLFTLESDLLLAHPDYREGSRGMIVASSHSLRIPDPGVPAEGPSEHAEIQFASEHAHGVFLAARALVAGTADDLRHDVWISVVGNGGLWPLERLGAAGGDDSWPVTRGWPVLFATASAIALLLLGYVGWTIRREAKKLDRATGTRGWRGWLLPRGLGATARSAYRMQHFYLGLLPMVAAGPHFLMALPLLHSAGYGRAVATAFVVLLDGAILALLASLWIRTVADSGHRARGAAGETGAVPLKSRLWIFFPATFTTLLAGLLVWAELWLAAAPLDSLAPFFLERSVAISSGVSPMLPVNLVFAVPLLWLLSSLSRHRALETVAAAARRRRDTGTLDASGGRNPLGLDLNQLLDRVRQTIDPTGAVAPLRTTVILTALGLGPFLYLVFYYQQPDWRAVRGVETWELDRFVTFAFLIAVLLVLGALVRFATGWWLALKPLTDGLKNLRFDRRSLQGRPAWWQDNGARVPDMISASPSVTGPMRASIFRRMKSGLEALEPESSGTTQSILRRILESYDDPRPEDLVQAWEDVVDLLERRGTERQVSVPESEASPPSEAPLLRRARSFFAIETAFFVAKAVSQLRQLLVFAILGLVLLLLTVSIYPFEPQRVLFLYVWSLIAASGAVAITILFEMERDAVISWISGTEERKVSWDRAFVARFASYAGLPILALLAGQFPQIRDALFQWIEPLTQLFL